MAQLDVQPKKTNPAWWIILILVLLALLFFFMKGCNNNETTAVATATDSTTEIAVTVTDWDSVDFDSPKAIFEEVTDKNINLRGNESYAIYGIGENVVFATDESAIQPAAETQLMQIASSLKKRYQTSEIAVYGNTDSVGTAAYNKKLGTRRAEAVKEWLINKGGIAADKISIHSRGESGDLATNETAAGRQLNRSVEIVAMAEKK